MKLNERELANTAKLVTSNSISKLGDILFDYVNSVWLSKLGNGSFWMAVYQSSETIVSVFVNFIGGILSDTKQRKSIIWICDIIAGLLCIALAVFVPSIWLLYAIIAVNIALSVLSSIRDPAYKAVFGEIVLKEQIGRVNSLLESCKQTIKVAGPVLAMVIAKFFGSKMALLLDGLTFIISGLLIRQLDILFETESPVAKQSNFSKIKDAFKYLLAEKNILIVIVFASVINFILAGYELILPFASFAFSKNAYAFFLTAESVGGLLGAVASNLIRKELSSKYLFWIIAVAGLPLAVMSLLYQVSHWLFGPIICITLFNFCVSVFNIQFMIYIQTNADMTYIGRVFSIVFTAAIIFVPLGSFFFQFVMDVKDSVDYLWLGGLLTFVAGLASVIYSLNQRRAE